MGEYAFPKFDLLNRSDGVKTADEQHEEAQEVIDTLVGVCNLYGAGVLFDFYEYNAATIKVYANPRGSKISKIKNLQPDFSAAVGGEVTLESPTDKPGHFALYVPKAERKPITIADFASRNFDAWQNGGNLSFPLGDDTLCDLEDMPHLLIGGATGSGKSVCINSIIIGLMYRNHPNNFKFMMIDPKGVELTPYNGTPFMLCDAITDTGRAADRLEWACDEMDRRYEILERANVRDVQEYKEKTGKYMQRLVIIIDELADLMMTGGKRVEGYIVRLAQKSRACGFHLIIATQEPRAQVVTGLIKANMPSRIAFTTSDARQSTIILGHGGAEKLQGKGDMLYQPASCSGKPMRLQGVLVTTEEIKRVVDFVKSQFNADETGGRCDDETTKRNAEQIRKLSRRVNAATRRKGFLGMMLGI